MSGVRFEWRVPPGVTRLVLVRHGEPAESFRGRVYGRMDVGLSAAGHAQAAAAAAFVARAPLAALYASPRLRALESAAPLAALRGLEVQPLEALREIDFGDFEGLTYEEAQALHPEAYAEWMAHPTRVRFPNGESFPQMRERVRACARALRQAHAGGCIALVSHGGVNRTLLAEALGLDDAALFRLGQEHAALNVVDHYADTAVVRLMNLTL